MTGVFRSGDDLVVKNYPFHRLIPGDIIVFTPTKTRKLIVHRVVALDSSGSVVTQGDHNFDRDPWQTGAARYQGRVIGFCRDGKLHFIADGVSGMKTFRCNQLRLKITIWLRKILGSLTKQPPFPWLRGIQASLFYTQLRQRTSVR